MQLRIASPGQKLKSSDLDRIEKDLEKIDRRLNSFKEVYADLRITGGDGAAPVYLATLELDYSRNHLIAKAESPDLGQAVRGARDEILRQINDRSRGSHSQYAKGR